MKSQSNEDDSIVGTKTSRKQRPGLPVRGMVLLALEVAQANGLSRKDIVDKTGVSEGEVSKVMKQLIGDQVVVQLTEGVANARFALRTSLAHSRWLDSLKSDLELKMSVARAAFAIICGGDIYDDSQERCCDTVHAIHGMINNVETRRLAKQIHRKRELTVFVDGGATGYHLARYLLNHASFPSGRLILNRLLIVTNCPPIAELLIERPEGAQLAFLRLFFKGIRGIHA